MTLEHVGTCLGWTLDFFNLFDLGFACKVDHPLDALTLKKGSIDVSELSFQRDFGFKTLRDTIWLNANSWYPKFYRSTSEHFSLNWSQYSTASHEWEEVATSHLQKTLFFGPHKSLQEVDLMELPSAARKELMRWVEEWTDKWSSKVYWLMQLMLMMLESKIVSIVNSPGGFYQGGQANWFHDTTENYPNEYPMLSL